MFYDQFIEFIITPNFYILLGIIFVCFWAGYRIGFQGGLHAASGYWQYKQERDKERKQECLDRHRNKVLDIFDSNGLSYDCGDSMRIKDSSGQVYCENCLEKIGHERVVKMIPHQKQPFKNLFFCPRCKHRG